MKQLTVYILGSALILLVLSCQSVDLSQKYPKMIADVDPFSVGTFEAQFDRFLSSKVKKIEVQAIFYPRLNAISLEFKYDLLNFRQFWDEPARKQFAASLELYKRDFEDQKLIDNYRKTRSVYGNVKGWLEWEAFKYTKTRVSNPTIDIGYRFKENTPFFTTLMPSAKEVMSDVDSSSPMDSPQLNMYFTRAQADELAGLFDQARLIEILGTKTSKIITGPAAAGDAAPAAPGNRYREYGE